MDTPADARSDQLAGLARAHQVDAIIVRTGAVTEEVIKASDRLRLIVKHGIGVDNIDLTAATKLSVPVINVPDAIADSVAEMTVAMIFALAKHLCRLDRSMHDGAWDKSLIGISVAGQTLGIIGFGRIARGVTSLVSSLSIRVMAYDKYVSADSFLEGVRYTESLPELLKAADTVVVLCPKTPETMGLIGAEEFRIMKETAYLINTARGGIVDEAALLDALNNGEIAGAALDTFDHEPLPTGSGLRSCEKVILTPHVAASSKAALKQTGLTCVDVMSRFFDGQPLDMSNLINRDVRIA